jgi:hypothetical protein
MRISLKMPKNLWPGVWEDAGLRQTVNEVVIYSLAGPRGWRCRRLVYDALDLTDRIGLAVDRE